MCRAGARAGGVERSPGLAAVHRAGVEGEGIRNVRLLERFALLEVPADQVLRITEAVDGTDVRGHTLRIQATR